MSKSKVLCLMHLPPPMHGAAVAGSYIRDSDLVSERFDAQYINISTSDDLRQIGRMSAGKLGRYFGMWCRLIGYLIRHGRPDVYYVTPSCRGAGLIKDLPLLSFLRLSNRPIAVYFHNKGLTEYLANHPILSRWVTWAFGRADTHAMTPSQRLDYDLKPFFRSVNIHAVPYGIPSVDEKYAESSRTGKTLIFLGNMLVSKGILDYLDACRRLKDTGVEFRALIVGGEADLTAADLDAEISKRGLEKLCEYKGPLYDNDKYDALSSADVLVFPTYYPYETFGLVNLEAMACGLSVISTDEGGIPDVVIDGVTGYIVAARSPEMIAEKAALLLSDREKCLSFGRAGRQKYLAEYTVVKFVERVSDILSICTKGELGSQDD